MLASWQLGLLTGDYNHLQPASKNMQEQRCSSSCVTYIRQARVNGTPCSWLNLNLPWLARNMTAHLGAVVDGQHHLIAPRLLQRLNLVHNHRPVGCAAEGQVGAAWSRAGMGAAGGPGGQPGRQGQQT